MVGWGGSFALGGPDPSGEGRLIELLPGLVWTLTEPFHFLGTPVGARMTIVRLKDGGLWVHSPLDVGEAVRGQIDALGTVRAIVAPSRWHSRCVTAFRRHYPDARLYVSPGLTKRRLGGAHAVLDDAPPAAWAGEIEQVLLRGHLFLDEVVFFHRESRTLILTDLLISIHADKPALARRIWRAMGVHRRPGVPPEVRIAFHNRTAARESLERILAWEFDRVLFCHGEPLLEGGRGALREAYRFLLGS